MGEDLSSGGATCGLCGELGRRATSGQGGADRALGVVESFPDALECSVAAWAVGGVDGVGDGADDGVLEKGPEGACGQAQASDFVGEPDTECPSAATPPMAVAAKDPSGSECFSLCVGVVKSAEGAVPNEHADGLAVGTGSLFEALGDGDPLLLASVKAWLLFVAHVGPLARG